MQIKIKKDKIRKLDNQVKILAPWMHSFKFTENLIVGYYKYEGVNQNLTFICIRENLLKKKILKLTFLNILNL